jgi:cytochrome c peroxidase
MTGGLRFYGITFCAAMAALSGCNASRDSHGTRREQKVARLHSEPLQPLPPAPDLPAAVVQLGERLFHEPRLSGDGSMSCASCHVIAEGGDDGKITSTGIAGQVGPINAPTVLDCGLNLAQFWDGRAATLEEQVGGPIQNAKEMDSTWTAVLATLAKDESYRREFAQAFPESPGSITEAKVRTAIASFERTLLTPNSPLDRWLGGEKAALTAEALKGYELFKAVGCIACHQGQNVGGNMFQRFGVIGDYFADRGNVRDEDYGRFNVTKSESDRYVFRVPSLRNVELTAPYFHDGSAARLEDAVRVMARYQLGRTLKDDEVAAIVAFLKSLTGELPRTSEGKVAKAR